MWGQRGLLGGLLGLQMRSKDKQLLLQHHDGR
jgi:hypothetical protein